MAKKKPAAEILAKKPAVKLTARDKKTNDSLVGLADKVVTAAKIGEIRMSIFLRGRWQTCTTRREAHP